MNDRTENYPVPDDFYRAFEDRFRGSQELISERLEAYVPFLRALRAETDAACGLDLGCGRGEWLRILEREGFVARGIDLDEGMLNAAREHRLNVENKDAIEALAEMNDGALDVISGFHIIEHLPFPTRLALISEARRVLRPGGLLILETPNPENVLAGTWSFHLDPTHIAPIPPVLMSFLADYVGYAQNTILRLHTPPPGDRPSITDVFTKTAGDFALVARTAGPENADLAELFQTPVGLDIFGALDRFDSLAHSRWSAGEAALEVLRDTMAERDADLEQQHAEIVRLFAEVRTLRVAVAGLRHEIDARRRRTLFEMLFFRPSGRPVKFLRRLAFHSNGRPRGGLLLRRIARKKNGKPRDAFARWMASQEYAALPWPASRAGHASEPAYAQGQPSAPLDGDEEMFGPLPGSHPQRYQVWARLDSAQRHKRNAK